MLHLEIFQSILSDKLASNINIIVHYFTACNRNVDNTMTKEKMTEEELE